MTLLDPVAPEVAQLVGAKRNTLIMIGALCGELESGHDNADLHHLHAARQKGCTVGI
jgi:hypothetical protein